MRAMIGPDPEDLDAHREQIEFLEEAHSEWDGDQADAIRGAISVMKAAWSRRRLANRVEVVDLWSVDRAALLRARHQAQKLGYGVRNLRSGEAGRHDAERIGLHGGRLFALREAAYDSRRWKRIGARQVPVDGAIYDLRRRR
jgi:hypothetical protein